MLRFFILKGVIMRFKSGTRRKAIVYENDLVAYWKENKTFEKSVEQRPKDNSYVFYDGPPFITGEPHHGTLLSSIVKDAIPRYWTMQGKRVERVWGWDCHGLPAEVFTEKKLGIKDKRDIGTKISLEEYITTCRENMVQTGSLWEDTINRIGRWVDFNGAYKTMDKEYMESVWWAFKTLYEKGKIYEGEKVLMYCTRDATPLAKAEIAMDNSYQDDTDPSVYVKFKLKNYTSSKSLNTSGMDAANSDPTPYTLHPTPSYLVVWTTTPWTLPSNSAVAVNKSTKYVELEYQNQVLIMAKNLSEKVMTDEKHQPLEYKILNTFAGSELVGQEYEPLFDVDIEQKNAFKVWHADFVTDEDGTGIAHQSPAHGEDDYAMAKEKDIPWILATDESGVFKFGRWQGENVWDINKQIAKDLLADGIVFKIDYITHSYPHCHRCNTKLMYRAVPSWFMDIDGQRNDMLAQNGSIKWHPEHIKHGRFEKTIQSAPDWNLSRDRFWATPIPVWKGIDRNGKELIKVVGSYDELEELSGKRLDDYHRPWIDDVTFTIDGVEYKKIEKVMDSWFEAGSMPFAQFHYPFENVAKFEDNFPSDFIVEYVGQVRAWFYYMHALSVGLFGDNAFSNVIVTGTVAGNDGRKMSKSFGNYTNPNELMDEYSADSLRLLLLSSSLMNGEDYALINKDVGDIARKLSMIWNVYDFFTLYAEVDNWEWNSKIEDHSNECQNVLDTWILSKVHTLINDVQNATEEYDLQSATRYILPFVDDLSNWYVRRSRKRFWKSDDDQDKAFAYKTLHYVLVQLAHVLAPFTPFLAEELYQKLTGGESVHLLDWPKVGHVNEQVVTEMDAIRFVVNEGLSQRSKAQIKVRQPLQSISVSGMVDLGPNSSLYLEVLKEELNVKDVKWSSTGEKVIELDLEMTEALKLEGVAREIVRFVQSARKDAGLDVDDRIELSLSTDSDELNKALTDYSSYIASETLTVDFSDNIDGGYKVEHKVNGSLLTISLRKK
jgi:isoleucyl-tRNA synthetase